MTEGSDYIYQCPHCGNLKSKESIASGNTFGAKSYSDGKMITPNLPEFPNLTQCQKCNTFLWLSKTKVLGSHWGDIKNTKWEKADRAAFLELDEYFDALKTGVAENTTDEVFIRTQILWAYNDRIRNGEEIFKDQNDEIRWKENCEKLRDLLDIADIEQRISIAEINRNLGNFEECSKLILSIDNEDLNWIKEIFAAECERKNTRVFELK